MELIDKDALLAKIIKRRDAALTRQHNLKSIGQESVLNEMIANELNLIISLINTLEVKEVDIDKLCEFRKNIGFAYPEGASEYQKQLACYRQGIKDVIKAQKGEKV